MEASVYFLLATTFNNQKGGNINVKNTLTMSKARAAQTAGATEIGNQSTTIGKQLTMTDRKEAKTTVTTTSRNQCISKERIEGDRHWPQETTMIGYDWLTREECHQVEQIFCQHQVFLINHCFGLISSIGVLFLSHAWLLWTAWSWDSQHLSFSLPLHIGWFACTAGRISCYPQDRL